LLKKAKSIPKANLFAPLLPADTSKGVLLPTVSDIPRDDATSIAAYFDSFLLKEPQGEILESFVTIDTNW